MDKFFIAMSQVLGSEDLDAFEKANGYRPELGAPYGMNCMGGYGDRPGDFTQRMPPDGQIGGRHRQGMLKSKGKQHY